MNEQVPSKELFSPDSEDYCAGSAPSLDLDELRRVAIRALDHPVDSSTPRHERDMVISAEVVIALIDDFNSKLSTTPEPPVESEARRLLRMAWGVCHNERRDELAAEIDAYLNRATQPPPDVRSMRVLLEDAERIVSDFARNNPRWKDTTGLTQDPWGAHAWLERYSGLTKGEG